jgi:formate C-acetyltransferase
MPNLSPHTQALAERALRGEWGRALVDLPLTLDSRADLADATPERRYAECVRLIATHAPLRILPGERIVGAATLAQAPRHNVPVYSEGKPAFRSTSHVTLGFDRALKIGYRGLRAEIEARLAQGDLDTRGVDLLEAMLICLEAAGIWHRRHLQALAECIADDTDLDWRTYDEVRRALANVPENPPTTFHEALQALWFLFSFQRLCGNWPGIGRVDEMLGPFLDADLASGRLNLDEARELLAHFWIKGCDWVGAASSFQGSGDGQFYQNVVLGGVDAQGRVVTNAVTYLVLDVVEALRISDFPIAVRISAQTPERLLRRIAEVQRLGTGTVAVYNEELILRSLQDFGYSLEEARRFANDGCWEIQIPGQTHFAYRPFDTLALLQQTLGVTTEGEPPDYADFEALYAAFRARLAARVNAIHADADQHAASGTPATLASLLTEDCIARGRGYHDRGARYNVLSPHAGGLPNTGNSLGVIRQVVYEERALSLPEFVRCLRGDWAGCEPLRQRILHQCAMYGNDDPAADAMTKRVFDDFLALVNATHERAGVLRPAGVSTFGREIEWRPQRRASADGHHDGAILATNFSPSPGTDQRGPTAVLASHCRMDLVRLTNGTALEIKLHPSTVQGEAGVGSLVALLRAFVRMGGIFLHIDVVDNRTLREAQQHPERYETLAVRVSGWSARFVTLNQEWQEMIIQRTTQASS